MVSSDDFTLALRRGSRSGTRRLVIHYYAGDSDMHPTVVGVVVPKKQVAKATQRNTIKRRIRHVMRERVDHLTPGSRIVIRGLAGAHGASSRDLAHDIDLCLNKAQRTFEAKRAQHSAITS